MLSRLGKSFLSRQFSVASLNLPVPYYKRSLQYIDEYDHSKSIISMAEFSYLIRKPDSILVKNWHREAAFDLAGDLLVPILNFKDGAYSGQCVKLDHGIFNLPLRRDIVHRVMVYESKLNQSITDPSKTIDTVDKINSRPTARTRRSDRRKDWEKLDLAERELLEGIKVSKLMAEKPGCSILKCRPRSSSWR